MRDFTRQLRAGALLLVLLAVSCFVQGCAEEHTTPPQKTIIQSERPSPKRQLFWGDVQVHSENSFGAALLGNQLSPSQVYRYARGASIQYQGETIALARALDFLVLADSSDNYGFFPRIKHGQDDHAMAKKWRKQLENGGGRAVAGEVLTLLRKGEFPDELRNTPGSAAYSEAWSAGLRAAEDANEPGVFTAFIAYEWSAQLQRPDRHGRIVVYRGGADSAGQIMPYTTEPPEGGVDVLGLWEWMSYFEMYTRSRVLAIVHSRQSEHTPSFDDKLEGQAQLRRRFEPALDVTSELSIYKQAVLNCGFVGGSGALTGLTSGSQREFYGEYPSWTPQPLTLDDYRQQGGGLTGVWAAENTRAEIFDAIARRETFVSTGSRMQLRVFAGWNFDEGDLSFDDIASVGYRKGVAMGGRLPKRSADTPVFLIEVHSDPEGGDLDQLQLLKTSIDESGQTYHKVYTLDWAQTASRQPNNSGDVALLPLETVELAQRGEHIDGSDAFKVLWRDPDFDSSKPASYVVRVIEAPTRRWPFYLNNSDSLPANALMIRHRALSSAIGYLPQ